MFGEAKFAISVKIALHFGDTVSAENMAYGSIYHLSPQFLPAYLAFLRSYRPRLVMGYPGALYTIARYALDHHDLPPPAHCLITTSETVLPEARQAMEAAFQCRLLIAMGR